MGKCEWAYKSEHRKSHLNVNLNQVSPGHIHQNADLPNQLHILLQEYHANPEL